MNVIYRATKDKYIKDEDITVYGIELIDNNGTVLIKADEVFFDKDSAESFARLCNELSLDPIHFLDAIDDVIG